MNRVIRTAAVIAAASVLLCSAAVLRAETAPEPSIVSNSWQLSFKYSFPRVIAVRLPDENKPQLYWYVTYTVTNETGADQLFIPDMVMLTDHGDLMTANEHISPVVFRAIKNYVADPLLESPTQVIGKILQGPDNARTSVAIWPVPDHDVDMVRIFFGGLSGETHEVTDSTGQKHELHKTLMAEFDCPGDNTHVVQKPFIKKKQEWVVR